MVLKWALSLRTTQTRLALLEKVKAHPGISAFDYVKEVSTKKIYKWEEGCWKWGICTGHRRSALGIQTGKADA